MLAVFFEVTRLFAEVLVPLFIYLLAIFIVWVGLSRVLSVGGALLLATVTVVGLGFLIPMAANGSTERAYAQAISGEVMPSGRIPLAGDIYLDSVNSDALPSPRRSSTSVYPLASTCGPLCRALLADPRVTSVTVATAHRDLRATPSPDAITYRRSTGMCGMPASASFDPIDRDTKYPSLGTVACVMGGPSIDHVDLHVSNIRQYSSAPVLRNRLWIERFEILDGAGSALLRRTRATTVLTSIPFRAVQHAPMRRRILEVPAMSGPGPSEPGSFPRAGALLLKHTEIE